MTDEPQNIPKLTPEQIKGLQDFSIGGEPYTVKDQVVIPDAAVSHWTQIPLDQTVFVSVTRGDFDRLYFAITQMNAASTMISETIRLVSFGDLEGANVTHRKAAELTQSADGNFRYFFKAIMSGAKPNG